MISTHRSPDAMFTRAVDLIERSGVVEQLEHLADAQRGPGGRPPRGITYTLRAVLVTLAYLIDRRTTPTLSAVLQHIVFDHTDDQLDSLGMKVTDEQRAAVRAHRVWNAEYRRFHLWLSRKLTRLDSGFDLPARRITNAEDTRRRADRSADTAQASDQAADMCRDIINGIVAASVLDPDPDGYTGDVVVDESTFDVCKTGTDIGKRPNAKRSAVYAAGYYRRAGGVIDTDHESGTTTRVDKIGFGVGITAIIRVGKPNALRAVVPLITGIDIHKPTAASKEGLANALEQHERSGFDPRTSRDQPPAKNTRWPYMTVDMGYNALDGFAELLMEQRYAMIASYPKHWGLITRTQDPLPDNNDGPARTEPGPIVGHGDIYCPAAMHLLKQGPLVERSRHLDEKSDLDRHDKRLANLFPLLMGTNSRPRPAAPTAGRPRRGAPIQEVYKLDVVCPAVQGRVRCPLKPESAVGTSTAELPTTQPTWEANEFRCCEKSQTTITLSPKQLKQYQSAFTPGSWEHILHFEAYRAMTERQFSVLKSPHVTALDKVNFGPRREPLLKIILALAIAVSNLRMQDDPNLSEVDSVTERLRQLERLLGRPPVLRPPRT